MISLFVAWPAEDPDGRALRRALDHAIDALPNIAGRRLVSVLIDTAAAPPADAVHALLADVARALAPASDTETSLAVDPRTLAPACLPDYRAAGIDRLVLRAWMLDGAAQEALAAAPFPRCAIDLAFARPGQTLAAWRHELDLALRLGAGHVSLEEHGDEGAGSDRAAAFYELAIDHLAAHGLPPYEIAHCARPGQESRQLLHGATGGDYLGIGPGAAGRITREGGCRALRQVAPAAAWLEAVAGDYEAEACVLDTAERRAELLLTGLRLRTGIARDWFEPLAGPLEAAVDAAALASLVEDGFVAIDRDGLRLTARGWPLCDAVLARLLK